MKNTATKKDIRANLNFAEGSYLESTSRPLYALLFLLPLIVLYELGTLFVNTDQIAHTQARVAAFTWLVGLAEWIGMNRASAWAFPGLAVVIILLCWHLSTRHSWRVRPGRLGWMTVESAMLTVPLFVLAAVMNSSQALHDSNNFAAEPVAVVVKVVAGVGDGVGDGVGATDRLVAGATAKTADYGSRKEKMSRYLANIVTSVGAGIYEELVFRLILMGLFIVLLEDVLKIKGSIACIIPIVFSAILFAGHHYIGLRNGRIESLEEFKVAGFLFRTAAGVYFAAIFRYRGYGITAGTHSVYNMIYFTLAG